MRKRVLVPPSSRRRRGAPCGNQNAYKHGKFTRERRALYADIRAYVREGRVLMEELRRSATSIGSSVLTWSPSGWIAPDPTATTSSTSAAAISSTASSPRPTGAAPTR